MIGGWGKDCSPALAGLLGFVVDCDDKDISKGCEPIEW